MPSCSAAVVTFSPPIYAIPLCRKQGVLVLTGFEVRFCIKNLYSCLLPGNGSMGADPHGERRIGMASTIRNASWADTLVG